MNRRGNKNLPEATPNLQAAPPPPEIMPEAAPEPQAAPPPPEITPDPQVTPETAPAPKIRKPRIKRDHAATTRAYIAKKEEKIIRLQSDIAKAQTLLAKRIGDVQGQLDMLTKLPDPPLAII